MELNKENIKKIHRIIIFTALVIVCLWKYEIAIILVLVTGCIGINAISLQKKNEAYKQQEIELQKQIDEEKKRAEEVDDFKEYINTEEYEKELAEDKLGLVDPDEIVFKAVD